MQMIGLGLKLSLNGQGGAWDEEMVDTCLTWHREDNN